MLTQKAKNPRLELQSAPSIPDKSHGWYYYQDSKIVGPTNFTDLFMLTLTGNDGRPILIRHSSQDKWHPISDLSSLDTPIWHTMRLHVQNERKDFIHFFNQKCSQLQTIKEKLVGK